MRVTLNHTNHVYKDERGQEYRSVSSFVSQYKQPFNMHKKQPNGKTLIENYVDKNGQSEQYWEEAWRKNSEHAAEKGTAFHDLKEMVVSTQPFHKVEDRTMPVRNHNQQWMAPDREGMFHLLMPGVYTELTLWNYMHKVAGTADKITIYEDKTFDVDDYKTNGKFNTTSFRGQCMKYPCTNLPDCHLGHYTLQLSLYAWMLKQFGLKPGKLRLHHYDIPDEAVDQIIYEGILPDVEPTIHEVAYVEMEVTQIMKERLAELKQQRRRQWV